jgi:hypothetical protein
MSQTPAVTESLQEGISSSLSDHYGKFAVISGQRLLGVHNSLDLAMHAVAMAFEDGALDDGAPILINEIGESPRLTFVAKKSIPVEFPDQTAT